MLEFKIMTDQTSSAEVMHMMRGLYSEDPADAGNAPGDAEFNRTIEFLLTTPERGRIILFAEANTIHGYALLIPYWSNEFGGTLLFVDELYVKPDSRSRGIGRQFFEFVRDTRPCDAIVCALEVSPTNHRARQLYTSIGFTPRNYTMMVCRFADHSG
jgi:GNAT superfamily N-acetyltransferase